MNEPLPDPSPNPLTFEMPAGACDAHFHLFPPVSDYPLAPDARYQPGVTTNADYQAMARAVGLERGIIVQPTAYGVDNSVIVDTLEENPNYRGIGSVAPDVSKEELRRLDRAGVKGIRMSAIPRGEAAFDYVRALARIAADMGWHVQAYIGPGMVLKLA